MMNKYVLSLMAMFVLAVLTVGCVSAEENVTADMEVPTDDIAIDDVSVDDAVEQDETPEVRAPTPATVYNVNSGSNFTYYMSTASSSNKVILNFTQDNYNNFALTLRPYVELWGNGVTINGAAGQDIFTVTSTSNIVIKDFILNVGSNAAAIYGHHVTHSVFTNNTIAGGKDGINIFQIHENLTITDNTISGFTRDGISLVNFDTMDDTTWNNFVPSTISGNNISCDGSLPNDQYGMFFGGNFKGVICNNNISGADYGIEFAGKKAPTNGRLNVTMCNNKISNVVNGIHLNHPGVEYLNLKNMYISASNYAIITGSNFVKTGYMYLTLPFTYIGLISYNFISNCIIIP